MSKKTKPSVVARIPDDLLIDIISRLPTKLLHRFLCVSKAFSSIALSQRRSTVLRPMSGLLLRFPYLPYYILERGLYVPVPAATADSLFDNAAFASRLGKMDHNSRVPVHSCNGLLLFIAYEGLWNHVSRNLEPRIHILVWNPISGESVALPKPPNNNYSDVSCCFLAYDPRESPHYNVIHFTFTEDKTHIITEVYSSITNGWDELRVVRQYPLCLYSWDKNSVFYKGALYMITREHLIRFDVQKKSFGYMLLPQKQLESGRIACIGESRGNLCYAVNIPSRSELLVYMIKNMNISEGKRMKQLPTHKISTEFLDDHPLITWKPDGTRPSLNFRPLAFNPESEEIYISTSNNIISYHLLNGRVEQIYSFTDYDGPVDWVKVCIVIPCLESIKPPGGTFISPSALENIM